MVDLVLLSVFFNFFTCLLLTSLFIGIGRRYGNFIMFNINLCFWSAFYGLYIIADSEQESVLYAKLTLASIILIPYLWLKVTFDVSKFKIKYIYKVVNNIATFALFISMFTPIMINGVKPFMDFKFIPDVTWGYYLVFLYFGIILTISFILLLSSIKDNYKNKLIFYGFLVGMGGGFTNMLPYIGVPIYPLGNFAVSLYCIIIAYALIKYRSLDSSVAISKMVVRFIIFDVLILLYFILTKLYYLFVPNYNLITDSLFYLLYAIVALEMYSVLVRELGLLLDKVNFNKSYNKTNLQEKINSKILDVVNIKSLSENIKHLIEKGMGVKIQSFYVAEGIMLGNEIDNDKDFVKSFGNNIPTQELKKIQDAMRKDGLILSVKRNEANSKLRATMIAIECYGLIPLIFGNKVMGFLALDSRPNKKDYFYYEDMELFDDLADKSGMALERVRLHIDIVRQKEKTLKSLAGSIAHEVRNPLSALSMISNQIKEHTSSLSQKSLSQEEFLKSKERLVDLTEMSLKSVRRTNQIIDMTLSDLKGEKIDKNKFISLNANESIENALDEYGYNDESEKKRVIFAKNKGMNFDFKGDETMFIYILFNLIKNALYYSKDHPDLTITISSKSNQDNNLIEIQDTGPGIPEDKIKSIFESFSTSGKIGGTGLGLSFCKRVMDSFDGSISCESELGKWTKFTLAFPKLSEEDAKKTLQSQIKPTKSLLLYDDRKLSLKASQSLLSKMGWSLNLDIAFNGQEILEVAKEGKTYDLIMLGDQMSDISTFEVAKEIKKLNEKTPIALYASKEFAASNQNNILECNIDELVTKSDPDKDLAKLFTKWILTKENNLTKEQAAESLNNQEILVADDEKLNLMMLTTFLTKNGLKVHKFNNAEDLLVKYKEQFSENDQQKTNKYSIVTDINMPNMTGNELAKEIRKHELMNGIKNPSIIVGHSGDSDPEKLHSFKKDGMDDFFIKGEDTNDLLKMLAFWLSI